MRIIDRYIFIEQLKIFSVVTAMIMTMLLFGDFRFLSDILSSNGISFELAIDIFSGLIAKFFIIAAPFSILISATILFSRMAASNELVVLRSAGVSRLRLISTSLPLTILIGILTAYLAINIVHKSNYNLRIAVIAIVKNNIQNSIEAGRISQMSDQVTIFTRAKEDNYFYDLLISDQQEDGKVRIIEARRGATKVENDSEHYKIFLEDGIIHTATNDEANYQIVSFDSYYFPLPFDKSILRGLGTNRKEKSNDELRGEIVTHLQNLGDNSTDSSQAPLIVEIHKRYSVGISCLLLGIIGVLLGMFTQPRSGSSGVALGATLLVLNYLIWTGGQALAYDGIINPILGAWLANIVIGIFVVLLLKYHDDITAANLFGRS